MNPNNQSNQQAGQKQGQQNDKQGFEQGKYARPDEDKEKNAPGKKQGM